MLAVAHDHEFTATPGLWERILEGGPLFVLLHALFAGSVIVAVVVNARRSTLPWMLPASSAPFIFASAAAHVGYLGGLLCLCGEFHLPRDASHFVYPTRVFNWGCIVSFILITTSLLVARKERISSAGDE